jgi:uncharacterized protein YbjT (DUF2867 family)
MRIVVAGGTGLIGSKVVALLRARGHDAVPAAPETGFDTLTGRGVKGALQAADVVIDVTNPVVFDPETVMNFFTTPGYLNAKAAQERLVAGSGLAFTAVRSTQFFENLPAMGAGMVRDDEIVLPAADLQPIAAADVAAALIEVVTSTPRDGVVEIAGPERESFARFIRPVLAAQGDVRPVRTDATAGYFGVPIVRDSLVPLGEARIGRTAFDDWSASQAS